MKRHYLAKLKNDQMAEVLETRVSGSGTETQHDRVQ